MENQQPGFKINTGTSPSWDQVLRRPFTDAEIAARAQVWCSACRNSAGRVCGNHKKMKCARCLQNLTEAHVDLDYVGHADVTGRLLDADPHWSWKPAYHQVPADVMMAAIATADPAVIAQVVTSYPPLIDELGGMWIHLILHDDEGIEFTRMGYGDAVGKSMSTTAVKEIIGDGIRNSAMRQGVALAMWSRTEHRQAAADAGIPADAGTAFESASAARPGPQTAGNAAGKTAGKRQEPAKPPAPAESPAHDRGRLVAAQGYASKAWAMLDERGTPEGLRAAVYEPASKARLLTLPVNHPSGGHQEPVTLSRVISDVKTELAQIRAPAGD